jgi:hypothetical protein
MPSHAIAAGDASPTLSFAQKVTFARMVSWLKRWQERGRTDVFLSVEDFLRHANQIASAPIPDEAIDRIIKDAK